MTTKEKFELIKTHEGVIKNIKKTITLHEIEIAANQKIIDDLWLEIKDAVDATPEKEIIFAGDVADLKIHYKKGIEKIDIADIEALPEEYIKTERTAKKRELLADFKKLRDEGKPLPNYALISRGEPTLTYSIMKEGY